MGLGVIPGEDTYIVPILAKLLHLLPHVNVTLHLVNNTFDPRSSIYLESLGILGSVPAAWLIMTLFVLLIYLLTRCCDRKQRKARSISLLKFTLAILSVVCCAALALGLYGNDDVHNGVVRLLAEAGQMDVLILKIRNQTDGIERQMRGQAGVQIKALRDALEEPPTVANQTLYRWAMTQLDLSHRNSTVAANAAMDIQRPLAHLLHLAPTIALAEHLESIRWPATMAVLSALLILCVILLVGVVKHSRCALIAFSVCGLLAVIASYLMASIYLASSVALGDLCTAPDRFVVNQVQLNRATPNAELIREILRYYTSCERVRANPFLQRLRECKTAIENVRAHLNAANPAVKSLYPRHSYESKLASINNDINSADNLLTTLTATVDCRLIHMHYLKGVRGICNVGLLGLGMMLASALLVGLLMTALVWIDSHTWIYIRKKKDYQQVNETDPYLSVPQTSQVMAARTLQRSQGSSYPPDTPPPSYSQSALLHHSRPMQAVHASAPPFNSHDAHSLLLDGCDIRTTDQHYRNHSTGVTLGGAGAGLSSGVNSTLAGGGLGSSAHLSHLRGQTLGRLPSHHHHHHHEPSSTLSGPNNGKYATLSKQCKTLESSDFY